MQPVSTGSTVYFPYCEHKFCDPNSAVLLHLKIMALVALAVFGQGSGPVWQQGAICDGTTAQNPRFMLSGKHLIIGDESWPPYNMLTSSGTWEGFNMDLLEAISSLLGFTYTMMDFTAQPPIKQTTDDGATISKYNAYLHDLEDGNLEADLLMSYWTVNTYRRGMKDLLMLSPHADGATAVLVYKPEAATSSRPPLKFGDAIMVALMPFTPTAWVLIVAVIVASSVIIVLLEKRAVTPDGKRLLEQSPIATEPSKKTCTSGICASISDSFYQSTMLIAQAGGHDARTRLGGLFLGFFAMFIFLIVIIYGSSLTAGLTAASVNNGASTGVLTIDALIAGGHSVCIREHDSNRRRLRNKYAKDGLTFQSVASPITTSGVTIDGSTEILRRMLMPRSDANEACTAGVVTNGLLGKWLAPGASAQRQGHLDIITAHYGLSGTASSNISELALSQCGVLDTVDTFDVDRGKTASWVTTVPSSCVGRAFDWALSHLAMEGTLAEIAARWFPRGPCRAANATQSDVAWTSFENSIDVDELSGAFLVWLLGTLLTGFGWILPGSHTVLVRRATSRFSRRRRRRPVKGSVLGSADVASSGHLELDA